MAQARRAADAASKKSLFEQLGDQQDKKKAEYDENTKLLFGEYMYNRTDTCDTEVETQCALLINVYITFVCVCVCVCACVRMCCHCTVLYSVDCMQLLRNVSMRRMWHISAKLRSVTRSFSITRSKWMISNSKNFEGRVSSSKRLRAANSPLCSRFIRRRKKRRRLHLLLVGMADAYLLLAFVRMLIFFDS